MLKMFSFKVWWEDIIRLSETNEVHMLYTFWSVFLYNIKSTLNSASLKVRTKVFNVKIYIPDGELYCLRGF